MIKIPRTYREKNIILLVMIFLVIAASIYSSVNMLDAFDVLGSGWFGVSLLMLGGFVGLLGMVRLAESWHYFTISNNNEKKLTIAASIEDGENIFNLDVRRTHFELMLSNKAVIKIGIQAEPADVVKKYLSQEQVAPELVKQFIACYHQLGLSQSGFVQVSEKIAKDFGITLASATNVEAMVAVRNGQLFVSQRGIYRAAIVNPTKLYFAKKNQLVQFNQAYWIKKNLSGEIVTTKENIEVAISPEFFEVVKARKYTW